MQRGAMSLLSSKVVRRNALDTFHAMRSNVSDVLQTLSVMSGDKMKWNVLTCSKYNEINNFPHLANAIRH